MFAKEPESDEVGLPTNWKKSQERYLKQNLDFSDIKLLLVTSSIHDALLVRIFLFQTMPFSESPHIVIYANVYFAKS